MSERNPYDWTHQKPQRSIYRAALLEPLVNQILSGNGSVVAGGRGMGKSVLLHQIQERLATESPATKVIYFRGPPVPVSVEASLQALAARLGFPESGALDAGDMLERYFSTQSVHTSCVVLYDELDQYVVPRSKDSLARALFNHLEAVRRDLDGRLGIIAAGGLGLYVLRDYLASAFMSRVEYTVVSPFTEAEIEELAAPFKERGKPLTPDVQKAITLASGGNPALVTYGMQQMWGRATVTERDVAGTYAEFRDRHPDFLRDIRTSVANPEFSEAPLRVWEVIQQNAPPIARATLLDAIRQDAGVLRMDLEDALRLLRAAGLVVVRGSAIADPLDVRPVASMLNLLEPTAAKASLREQLVDDLRRLLHMLHRWAPDWFYSKRAEKDESGNKGSKEPKGIVPESVFCAIVAIGLHNLGWTVEREALQAAGRTDLKLRRAGGLAVVEVKLWDRNDYDKIHEQVEGYWTSDVVAGAAVMITDRDLPSFAESYQTKCLSRPDLIVTKASAEPPLRGHFAVESKSPDGFPVIVDHLLLRVPRS